MRDVDITIRIPEGKNCRNCMAKSSIMRHSQKYIGGDFVDRAYTVQRDVCLLYGVALNSHSRRVSGTRDPWGHNETAVVIEKCDACLKRSEEYAITGARDGGDGHAKE